MQRKPGLKKLRQVLAVIMCVALTATFPKVLGIRGYYVTALIYAVITMAALVFSFEKGRQSTLKISLIAVLSAGAIAGRVVFAAVPFVKPVAALVIICGISLGALPGFVCGSCAMLVSNFMFGQGPWTIWQMLAFGLPGYVSGLIFYSKPKWQKKLPVAVFGFVFYVFFAGPILDLSGLFIYTAPTKTALVATLAAGFPVNLTGGGATAVFLLVLFGPITKKLNRIKIKYGI